MAAAAGPTILHQARQAGGTGHAAHIAPRGAAAGGATGAAELGGAVALEDVARIVRRGMISCGDWKIGFMLQKCPKYPKLESLD